MASEDGSSIGQGDINHSYQALSPDATTTGTSSLTPDSVVLNPAEAHPSDGGIQPITPNRFGDAFVPVLLFLGSTKAGGLRSPSPEVRTRLVLAISEASDSNTSVPFINGDVQQSA